MDNPNAAAALMPAHRGNTVRVSGIDVVPETDYKVLGDSGALGSPALSAPGLTATTLWGDVVDDFNETERVPLRGVTNFIDISAVL